MTRKDLKEKIGETIMLTGRQCIIKSIDDEKNIIKLHWLDNNRHSSRDLNALLKSFEKLKNKKAKVKDDDNNFIINNDKIVNIIDNFERNLIKNETI